MGNSEIHYTYWEVEKDVGYGFLRKSGGGGQIFLLTIGFS